MVECFGVNGSHVCVLEQDHVGDHCCCCLMVWPGYGRGD